MIRLPDLYLLKKLDRYYARIGNHATAFLHLIFDSATPSAKSQ